MAESWEELLRRLNGVLARHDRESAARLVFELTGRLHRGEPLAPEVGARFLGALRRKRLHGLLEQLAETFRFAGVEGPKLRRLFAQSLIDQGKLEAASGALEALAAATAGSNPGEHAEAVGLLGRLYKQRYVDAANSSLAATGSVIAKGHLRQAFDAYHSVYREAPGAHLWHGINAVAVACRATADGFEVAERFDAQREARTILAAIEAKYVAAPALVPAWDLATALESCVALDRTREAERWLAAYTASQEADAFELNSTLRQLTEVWRLTPRTPPGSRLIPVLEAQLARRQGGRLELDPREVAARHQALGRGDARALKGLQRTFGAQGVVTYQWYCQGLDRFRWVARICDTTQASKGTGFLVRGSDLDSRLGKELVLVTNAHVVSDEPAVLATYGALHPSQAVARFEAWGGGAGAGPSSFAVRSVLFTSPPDALDVTVLRLDPAPPGGVTFPIAAALPMPAEQPPVYVIGHPLGGGLSISISDNLLLDRDDRRLHYRAPTEPGSSGSPVFDRFWALIALHHAGDAHTPQLNGKAGTYEANEGIAFPAIAAAMRAAPLREVPAAKSVPRPRARSGSQARKVKAPTKQVRSSARPGRSRR